MPNGKDENEADSFLEVPAIRLAARVLAREKASIVGQSIGPYRVLKFIGAGGMGEVFLAEDTRLGRNVALKLLPAEVADDPGRVGRFEQEARAASTLNHPNVLVIYDVGVHNGRPYIASEYLEGETLRERLRRSPLPTRKAIDFAIQIARALAATHETGIIHRDLKPENLFITREERIKILDFGLAKLADPAVHVRAPGGDNPKRAKTIPGIVMGTLGYLSPEQLRGQAVDHRSDIFAFGAVLYEMLTGQRAFHGSSEADTISAILHQDPPEISVASVRQPLSRIVSRCLEKSPPERFQSARDIAFTLEAVYPASGVSTDAPEPAPQRFRWAPLLVWILASLLLLSLAVFVGSISRKPVEPNVERFEMPLPGGDPSTGGPTLALSPDGKYLAVLAAAPNGDPMLWVRSLDNLVFTPVPGTEGIKYPFWSADSRSLAFQVDNRIRVLDVSNGARRTLRILRGIVNGAWNAENVIIVGTGSGPLLRISGGTGEAPVPVTKIDSSRQERSHWWPDFLPDQRHFLYTARAATLEQSGVYVASLDSKDAKLLVSGVTSNAMFAPPGYLLYAREGALIARQFNLRRLEVTGEETPVADQLKTYYGYAAFSVSDTGTLVYRTGVQAVYQLSWFDRTGRNLGSIANPLAVRWSEGVLPLWPALSPDGKLIATVRYRAPRGAYDIWITDSARNNLAYPITNTSNAEAPVWSPDGTHIAYSAAPEGGARDLFIKNIEGTAPGELIFHSDTDKWPLDWSSDGEDLLFRMLDSQSRSGLWLIAPHKGSTPRPIAPSSLDVEDARISPDGRWLSYSSRQSGTYEVYLQDFPAGHRRTVISNGGGRYPHWQRDSKQLFYLSPADDLMAIEVGPDFVGNPRVLFKTAAAGPDPYTVSSDGARFLIQTRSTDSRPSPLTFTLNWVQGLRR